MFFPAPEDCAAHSLSKEDPEREHEVCDEEWKAKNEQEPEAEGQSATGNTVKSIETNVAGADNTKGDADVMEMGSKTAERTKAENIVKLKLQLAKLDEQFPVPEELKWKAGPKKSVNQGKPKGEGAI